MHRYIILKTHSRNSPPVRIPGRSFPQVQSEYIPQGLSAHFHARLILRIEVLTRPVGMDEEDLEDVALDRVPALLCQNGDDLFHALSEVVPVLYICLIARQVL